jgi:protein tyrosine/serine phosphatase
MIPNFHKVHDFLYRGAQPGPGGMLQLAELGIKTIVDLRRPGLATRREAAEAGVAGLRYVNVPLARLLRPAHREVARVMSIIDAREARPVFVHCQHGSDRTGMIVAVHRLLRHGWTDEQALAEARRHGMSRLGFALRSYVADYYRARIGRRDRAASFEPSPLMD